MITVQTLLLVLIRTSLLFGQSKISAVRPNLYYLRNIIQLSSINIKKTNTYLFSKTWLTSFKYGSVTARFTTCRPSRFITFGRPGASAINGFYTLVNFYVENDFQRNISCKLYKSRIPLLMCTRVQQKVIIKGSEARRGEAARAASRPRPSPKRFSRVFTKYLPIHIERL